MNISRAILFLLLSCIVQLLLIQAVFAQPYTYTLMPGSTAVDVSKIQDYHAKWRQLVPKDGGGFDLGGLFEEQLVRDGDVLLHTQKVHSGQGQVVTEVRKLHPVSLQALSLSRSTDQAVQGGVKSAELLLDGNRYAGDLVLADEQTISFEHQTEHPSFDGWILGVTLAALPLEPGYEAKLPAVVQFQRANYQVVAKVREKRTYLTETKRKIPVWVVDTDWINTADGSVSKGGEQESGGTYLMAVKPGNGIPYVGVIRWQPS